MDRTYTLPRSPEQLVSDTLTFGMDLLQIILAVQDVFDLNDEHWNDLVSDWLLDNAEWLISEGWLEVYSRYRVGLIPSSRTWVFCGRHAIRWEYRYGNLQK